MTRALLASFGIALMVSGAAGSALSEGTTKAGKGNVGANETITVGGSRTESTGNKDPQVKANTSPAGRRKPAEIVVVGSKSTGPKTSKGK